VRRWTLVVVVLLFIGLVVAAAVQFTVGQHKHVRCPGPHASFGGPHAIVRCVTPTPSGS
jgi:hypothetical protein